MNMFEIEIAKNERRIKRIEDKPDARKLRTTKLYYELQRDQAKAQLDWCQQGRPFLAGNYSMFQLLAKALGVEWIDLGLVADKVPDVASKLQQAHAAGVPEHMCERNASCIGAYITTGLLPKPAGIIATAHDCLPFFITNNALSRDLGVPIFVVDVPLESGDRALEHVTSQLSEIVEWAERLLPGFSYDESKISELQEMDRLAHGYLREIYDFLKQVPCPIAPRDVFRILREPSCQADPKKGLSYFEAFRDEVAERVQSGVGAVVEEKLRILWAVSGPLFADVFEVLVERGASMPFFANSWSIRAYGIRTPLQGNVSELSPLQQIAAWTISTSWWGSGMRWIEDLAQIAKDLGIDGIVHFLQFGCTPVGGLGKLLSEKARKDLNIPVLNYEGGQLDATSFDGERFNKRLEEFLELCLMNKLGKPGLAPLPRVQ